MKKRNRGGRPSSVSVDAVRTACISLMKNGESLSAKNIREQTKINGSAKKFLEIRNLALKEIADRAG